jgi:predicted translin family RNA/ssDNA-binding protein
MEIEIGKFTLESLTTGMYSEPESCYREYIQNSVDSLDTALAKEIMQIKDCRIEIIVDNARQEINIKDNGTGINKDLVRKTLLDIGNSSKKHTINRGFRGIGRLGGLSYCKKLSFCTSALGENIKSLVSFDCEKLKELLIPGQSTEHNLQSVIETVTEVHFMQEQESMHYFIVKMEGVDDISALLDFETVKDYIAQVAPVPFRDRFYWRNQIKEKMLEYELTIAEYPVFIGESFESLTQVFKPYKNAIEANSKKSAVKDEVLSLSFFNIYDGKHELMAIGWYANTDFSGTLVDDSISGIRVRQGNILIGNQYTIAPYFKESRFNRWAIGEIYVISRDLIPNARRDDFEKNKAFVDFISGLQNTVCSEVIDKIRTASKMRNNPDQKIIKKVQRELAKVNEILEKGFHSNAEKEQVEAVILATRKDLYAIPKSSPSDVLEQKTELNNELIRLADEVEKSTNFRIKKDIPSNFSKAERKIIQAIMEVLTRNFERATVDSLYSEILHELKLGGKN